MLVHYLQLLLSKLSNMFSVSTIPEEEEEHLERSLRLLARAGAMESIQESPSKEGAAQKKSPTSSDSPRLATSSYSLKSRAQGVTSPVVQSPRSSKVTTDAKNAKTVCADSDNVKSAGSKKTTLAPVKEPVKRNITPGNKNASLQTANKTATNNSGSNANTKDVSKPAGGKDTILKPLQSKSAAGTREWKNVNQSAAAALQKRATVGNNATGQSTDSTACSEAVADDKAAKSVPSASHGELLSRSRDILLEAKPVRRDSKGKIVLENDVKNNNKNKNELLLRKDSVKVMKCDSGGGGGGGDRKQSLESPRVTKTDVESLSKSVIDFNNPTQIKDLSVSLPASGLHGNRTDPDGHVPSDSLPPIATTMQQTNGQNLNLKLVDNALSTGDVITDNAPPPPPPHQQLRSNVPRQVGQITRQLKMQNGAFPALVIQREASLNKPTGGAGFGAGGALGGGGSRRSSARKAAAIRRTSGKHGGSRRSGKRLLSINDLNDRPSTRDSLLSIPYDPSFDYYSDDFTDYDSGDTDSSDG